MTPKNISNQATSITSKLWPLTISVSTGISIPKYLVRMTRPAMMKDRIKITKDGGVSLISRAPHLVIFDEFQESMPDDYKIFLSKLQNSLPRNSAAFNVNVFSGTFLIFN